MGSCTSSASVMAFLSIHICRQVLQGCELGRRRFLDIQSGRLGVLPIYEKKREGRHGKGRRSHGS